MPEINCIVVDDEPTAREILEHYIGQVEGLYLAGSCKNALEAFNLISEQAIDLVFLDINMPEMSGISLAKSLGQKIKVIFTTAYREYAVEGFDLQAVDYLLKPIAMERFLQAVQKYRNETTLQSSAAEPKPEINHIFIKADKQMIKVAFTDIYFVESLGDYLKIHTIEKVLITRETITTLAARLPEKDFIRIHRSFIVAARHISSYTRDHVYMQQKELPISRSYRTTVLNLLKAP